MPRLMLNSRWVDLPAAADTSLLDFLRQDRGLTAAKPACGSGDCSACLVLVGEIEAGHATPHYRALSSCLLTTGQVADCHVITAEGLNGVEQILDIGHFFQQARQIGGSAATADGDQPQAARRQAPGRKAVQGFLFADLPDRGQKAGQDVLQRGPVFGGDTAQQRDGVRRDRGIDGGLAAEAGGKAQAHQQGAAGQHGRRGIWHAGRVIVRGIRVGFRQILVILQPLQELMREIGPAGLGGASGFLRGGLRDGLVLGHGRCLGMRGRAAPQGGAGGMI